MVVRPFPTNVIIHLWLLFFAVLLLWFPRQWLRLGKKVVSLPEPIRDEHREANDVSLKLSEEFRKLRNWVDFLRSLAGGLVVMVVGWELPPDASHAALQTRFLVQCAVLVIAVLIQVMRFQRRLVLVSPVFFILGLSFGLIGWKSALFACASIWVLNLVLPSAEVFFAAFAVLQLVFPKFIARGPGMKAVFLAVALAMTPVVLSLVTNRRLVLLNRRRHQSARKG